jgi:hypothetical protein
LSGMVSSCMLNSSCTLEGLSTTIGKQDTTQIESRMKQSKRWLASKWTDTETFYEPYIGQILLLVCQQRRELVLIIDGSESAGNCSMLMVSALWGNYAIPVAWTVKQAKKGHFSEETHIDLIHKVYKIIPCSCRTVLLGDGEFDGKQLAQTCMSFKWEFVLRTSKDRIIDDHGEAIELGRLHPWPNTEVVFVESAIDGYNALLWHCQDYEHPIPLLTNMELGEMACSYYERRSKIESQFKQFKSAGFNLHKSKIMGAKLVSSLIIVLALAFLLTFFIGLILPNQSPEVLKKITRLDRLKLLSPIKLALKALKQAFWLVSSILSNISKNFSRFFSTSG